jgi:ABC-type multidrug transport system ATPase subunit
MAQGSQLIAENSRVLNFLTMNCINVQNLSKHYKDIKAVDDISFSVSTGEVYGFLGQNGAGKSTTIRMLLSLVQPTNGKIEVFGLNLFSHRKEILSQIGAVIERPDLYTYLTGYENISLFARLSGKDVSKATIIEKLEMVGLRERMHSKVKTYSQGMKQRLGLAVALVHDPKLVILDEPTNGLDPQGIADVRNLILHLSRDEGKTIFVSSHLLNEMEMIADRMLIIDRGRSVKEGAIGDLFDPSNMLLELVSNNPSITSQTVHESNWKDFLLEEQSNRFLFRIDKNRIPMLTRFLVDSGTEIISLQPKHSLEQYFLSLTTANQHVDPFKN